MKFSAPHIEVSHNTSFLVDDLDRLAPVSPKEVGLVYREMLDNGIYPIFRQEQVISTVEALYDAREKELADSICNVYGAAYDFLWQTYEKHNTQNQ